MLTRNQRTRDAARKAKESEAEAKRPKLKPAKVPSAKRVEAICRQAVAGFDAFATAGPGERFDANAAQAVVRFFHEELSHVKGRRAGQPFALEEWQIWTVGNLFGWRQSDGTRRFRECLIFIPRKNGKTPLAAGILLYLLFCDNEPGAEIYGAAEKYKTAGFAFSHAAGMVRQNPRLAERCRVYKGQAQSIQLIAHPDNVDEISTYVVVGADHSEGHGYNTHAAVIDELHLQPTRELVDQFLTSTASADRVQPLILYITTSDYERPGSICNEKHDYATKVRDWVPGFQDRTFLPVIFEATREDDWTSETTWAKANPNLGVSVSLDYLKKECEKAKESSAYENTFKRLHLNIRTEQDIRWLSMERWDSCSDAIDLSKLAGCRCYAGLDLAATSDLTAFVLIFDLDGVWYVVPYFWVPEDCAEKRSRKDRVPYSEWVKAGLMETTPGDMTDYATIRRRIGEIGEEFPILELAVDRLFQGGQLASELQADGHNIIAFGQGFAAMAGPTNELERLVLSRGLQHGGHPVLRWMASNVTVEMDAYGNKKPSKKKSTEKIDGIVSLIMAIGRATIGEGESPYEARGVFSIG